MVILLARRISVIGAVLLATPCVAQVQQVQGGRAPVGGRTIVGMNFSGSPVGDFPAGIDPNTGNLEVVDKNGQRMLRATSESSFLVTLPELMPQDFLLEFDLIPKTGHGGYDFSVEGTREIDQGPQSIHLLWHSTNVRGIGGGGTNGFDSPMPLAVSPGLAGAPTSVVVSVRDQRIQFFANGVLTHTLPNRRFARSRILRVSLGGENEDDGAVYLSRFRVAAMGAATNVATNQNAMTGSSGTPTTTSGRAAPGVGGATSSGGAAPVTTTSVGSRGAATTQPSTPPAPPAAGASQNGATLTTIPGPANLTTRFLMDDNSGWGMLLTFTPVPNATGYRVTRVQNQLNLQTGAVTAATSPVVANVTDVTAYMGVQGAIALVDPYVIPNAFYTYTVEALLAGSAYSSSASSSTQIGNYRMDPMAVPNATPIQATVSATRMTAMPGALGATGPQQGSDVTWTWNVPGLVLLYETSYEIVGAATAAGPVTERFTVPTGLPPKQPSLTLGVPAGADVKFCVSFYALSYGSSTMLPQEAGCVTTTVPSAPTISGTSTVAGPSPNGGSRTGTTTQKAAATPPGPTTITLMDLAANQKGWGVVVAFPGPLLTGTFRVSRTITGSGAPATVVNTVDVTSVFGKQGAYGFVDTDVWPGTNYTYWVEALYPDGTVSAPSNISSIQVSSFVFGNVGFIGGPPIGATAVSGTKTVTIPGGSKVQGSDVTWIWQLTTGPVFLYETSYELLDVNGAPTSFHRTTMSIPVATAFTPSTSTVTMGVPQGQRARFCVAPYAPADRTKPLPPEVAACVVTSVP